MFGMQEKHASLLDHFDVKSLRLLAALLDTESISRAGDALQLSQPAASRAVARMRQLLGDRLLVRTSKGYTLTNRAKALKPQVEAVLAALEQLFEAEGFDPATSRRTFRIAATDYGSITILDRLVTQLARQAPSLALDIVPFGSHTLADLESGALDCAWTPPWTCRRISITASCSRMNTPAWSGAATLAWPAQEACRSGWLRRRERS